MSTLLSIARYIPFLTRRCAFSKRHWRWERLCEHGFGYDGSAEVDETIKWHGGLLDMDGCIELQPCAHCTPAYSLTSAQWALDEEETCLLAAWRMYRSTFLNAFGDGTYKYTVNVDLNGVHQELMSRTMGLAALAQSKDTFPKPKKDEKAN